jgi:Zn-dependent M32 family carboxypeptidase
MTTNCVGLSMGDFNKHISKNGLTNDDYEKIFEELNHKYIDLSKEVQEVNEKRSEILDKIRILQLSYKKNLGKNILDDCSNPDENNNITQRF